MACNSRSTIAIVAGLEHQAVQTEGRDAGSASESTRNPDAVHGMRTSSNSRLFPTVSMLRSYGKSDSRLRKVVISGDTYFSFREWLYQVAMFHMIASMREALSDHLRELVFPVWWTRGSVSFLKILAAFRPSRVETIVLGGTRTNKDWYRDLQAGLRLHEFIEAITIELAAPGPTSWDTDDDNWSPFGLATLREPTVSPHIEVAARAVDIKITRYESELALIDRLLSEAADSLVTLELAVQKPFPSGFIRSEMLNSLRTIKADWAVLGLLSEMSRFTLRGQLEIVVENYPSFLATDAQYAHAATLLRRSHWRSIAFVDSRVKPMFSSGTTLDEHHEHLKQRIQVFDIHFI
ncbi:hypothetical protein EV122DRAFT_255619 [Schizophyllum commune]